MTKYDLSRALAFKIVARLNQLPPLVCNWHPSITLSPGSVNGLLKTNRGYKTLVRNIRQKYATDLQQLKRAQIREVIQLLIKPICKELEIEPDAVSTKTLDLIIARNELELLAKEPDLNLKQLFDNTRPRIVLRLDPLHGYTGREWRDDAEYNMVKEILTLLNINPQDMHSNLPSRPGRNGHEYVELESLKRLFDRTHVDAMYVIPLDYDMYKHIRKPRQYSQGLILPAGSEIWSHLYDDTLNIRKGKAFRTAGPVTLLKDLLIKKSTMPYTIVDERIFTEPEKPERRDKRNRKGSTPKNPFELDLDWDDDDDDDDDESRSSEKQIIYPFQVTFCKLNKIRPM